MLGDVLMPGRRGPRRVEVITGVVSRRYWPTHEKHRNVEESFTPGESVSAVARRNGVAPNLLFYGRRLMAEGGAMAVGSNEPVVAASEARRLLSWLNEPATVEALTLTGAREPENVHEVKLGYFDPADRRGCEGVELMIYDEAPSPRPEDVRASTDAHIGAFAKERSRSGSDRPTLTGRDAPSRAPGPRGARHTVMRPRPAAG